MVEGLRGGPELYDVLDEKQKNAPRNKFYEQTTNVRVFRI